MQDLPTYRLLRSCCESHVPIDRSFLRKTVEWAPLEEVVPAEGFNEAIRILLLAFLN